MRSTSLSCLHSMDVLNAKRRCGIVYFQRTKFFQCCVFLTTFILISDFCSAQGTSTSTYFTENEETNNTKEQGVSSHQERTEIRPFYEHGNLKLKINITSTNFVGAKTEGYSVNVTRTASQKPKKCSGASEYYYLLNNDTSYIIIPDSNEHSTFFLSKCKYVIKITSVSETDYKVLKLNYKIPGTSIINNNSIAAHPYYDKDTQGIKLNVTWEKPTGPLLPTGYHIKISPLYTNKEHCELNTQLDETYTSGGMTSTILPKNVIPDCSYTIAIEEDPTNDLIPPHINYTIPDCVEKHCTCMYTYYGKPNAPNISVVQLSMDVIQISWKIPISNMRNITSIKFKVGLPQYVISQVLHERNISDLDTGLEMMENVTVPHMKQGVLYAIHAWYVNASNCESLPARLTYYGQSIVESQGSSQSAYHIMMSVMFALMILFLMCFLWKRRVFFHLSSQWICYWLRGQHAPPRPQVRRIYRPTTDGNRTRSYLAVPNIPMEYNNLYIEKEIAEEQERGKADKYEISYSRLEMGVKIGKGAFGQVFLARATAIAGIPGHTTVAVKKLEKSASPEEMEEFLFEISMLKQIGRHPNIVTLLGCCTLRQPYCMIMEYLPFGDLLHYLRTLRLQYEQKGKAFLFTVNKSFDIKHQQLLSQDKQKVSDSSYITPESIPSTRLPSVTETEYTVLSSEIGEPVTPEAMEARDRTVLECVLDPKELQSFALQIARGMQHLERKQIVHRDLAARNVLINETKTLKISDFGLSRSGIYINSRQKKVPLRWLSVEAIRDNLYTSKSDVWAYGVVLWEIGTLGGFPYPTVTDHEILKYLLKGERLDKPENCTEELYELMQQCWSHAGDQRPSFTDLVEHLENISSQRRVYVDFNQLNPSYVFPPTEEQSTTQIKTENNIKTIEIVLTDKDR